ncbi:MAG: DUF4340 domain-containing protein [Bacteroidota bacterium]
MFKRFTNKQLGIGLAALAILYLAMVAFGGRKARTFEKTLAAVDTTAVNKILISTPDKGEVELLKEAGTWRLKMEEGKTAPVQANNVRSAIGGLALLEASQLVSRDEDDWGEYQVGDKGTKVQLLGNDTNLLDVILGSFTYRTAGMNYIRLEGEDETYLVEGYLEGNFNKAATDWRQNKISDFSSADVQGIGFSLGADAAAFQIQKDSSQNWIMMPDAAALDQSEVSTYLSSIYSLKGKEFVDRAPASTSPAMQISIQTATKGIIELRAYTDAEHGYLIHSSQNPESYFSGNAEGLFDKLFVSKEKFFVKEE